MKISSNVTLNENEGIMADIAGQEKAMENMKANKWLADKMTS